MPEAGDWKSTLKQLGSAAVGMVGALALNEALGATFKKYDFFLIFFKIT